jgi:hypothetical protein
MSKCSVFYVAHDTTGAAATAKPATRYIETRGPGTKAIVRIDFSYTRAAKRCGTTDICIVSS